MNGITWKVVGGFQESWETGDYFPEKNWLHFGRLELGSRTVQQSIDVKSESEVGKTSYDAVREI